MKRKWNPKEWHLEVVTLVAALSPSSSKENQEENIIVCLLNKFNLYKYDIIIIIISKDQ